MIVRTWHGAVPLDKSESFREYLIKTGITEAKKTSGNLAVFLYNQTQNEYVHYFMASCWTDLEAIKAFAGDNPHIAVTYPEDAKYGLISDPIVLHHEVASFSQTDEWTRF